MISHEVKIIATDPTRNTVHVSLKATGACAGCSARKACTMSESQDKKWTVDCPEADTFTVGETACLQIQETIGLKAVGWAYALPAMTLIGIIVGLSFITDNELIIGLSALGGVILYIGLLRLFRNRLNRTLTYTLRHL